MGEIKEETAGWLNKAKSALLAAEALRERGLLSESIARAYYAMFYAAKALLCQDNVNVNKHSAVISAFGRNYARTKRLSPELHKQLISAFKERGKADYNVFWEATEDLVARRLNEATSFVHEITSLLKEDKS